jgi:hypothetical protein
MAENTDEQTNAGRISFVPVGIGFLGLAAALVLAMFYVEGTVGRVADGVAAAVMGLLGAAVIAAEAARLRHRRGEGE